MRNAESLLIPHPLAMTVIEEINSGEDITDPEVLEILAAGTVTSDSTGVRVFASSDMINVHEVNRRHIDSLLSTSPKRVPQHVITDPAKSTFWTDLWVSAKMLLKR